MMNNGSDIMHEIGTAILYRALSIGLSYNFGSRSEEHTSELQSQSNLVCRLLLEKKIEDKQVVRAHETRSVLAYGEHRDGLAAALAVRRAQDLHLLDSRVVGVVQGRIAARRPVAE